jgi:hypothetical protein
MPIQVTVNPNLKRRITKGIRLAMDNIISDIKSDLKNVESNISIYADEGKRLSVLLKKSGLRNSMYPGALRDAWVETVDNIKVVETSKGLSIDLFDSTILDKGTPWYGLPRNPDDKTKKSKKQIIRRDDRNTATVNIRESAADFGGIVVDGYRPLPSRGSFKWTINPYPGNGYWKIYDQGYLGGGISYYPRNFIHTALFSILGESTGRIYAYDNALKFSSRLIKKIEKNIANRINVAVPV